MRIPKHQKRTEAFTLMEVLVVVVVIGLLSAIVTPRFLASQGMRDLEVSGTTLQQDLEWARLQTVSTQQRHYLVLDSAGRNWKVYRETGGNLTCNVGSDLLVRTQALETSVNFGFGANFSSLPGSLAATNGFASTTVPRSGFGTGVATTDDCLEGATTGSGSWSSTITACVSRGVLDIETGVVYLSSKRTSAMAFGILFNDKGTAPSLQIQRWVWRGSWARS